VPKTVLILRILYIASALYAFFILNEVVGILILIPLFFNTTQNMGTYWTKLKLVCGVVWMVIMVRLYFHSLPPG